MPKLLVACPGDSPVPETHTVFLVDDRFYSAAFFDAHFDQVEAGPGVERIIENGEAGFRVTREGESRLEALRGRGICALFFTGSDTHVRTFLPVAAQCDRARFVIRYTSDHSARAFLEKSGKAWETHGKQMAAWRDADVALTGNDWGLEDRLFVAWARQRGLRSACLQESMIDFHGNAFRMCCADYAFIQGPYTLRYLKRAYSFLVGNPRYDDIKPLPLPPRHRAFINCNFTFGVFEEAGRGWVDDVVSSAQRLGLDFTVSLHPRCFIDLSGIPSVVPSNAFVVHEQLAASTMVVTRFSSLAHEALLMGRHVIYYNPHGETMRYLNEDATGLLAKAYSREELEECLRAAMRTPPATHGETGVQAPFQNLFCATDGQNHIRCATALRAVAEHANHYPPDDALPLSASSLRARTFIQDRLRPGLARVPGAKFVWRSLRRVVRGQLAP